MARTVVLPLGRFREAVRYADRTAYRDVRASFSSSHWGDVEVREWPTRVAMARFIRREEHRATLMSNGWRPVEPLGVTEGY